MTSDPCRHPEVKWRGPGFTQLEQGRGGEAQGDCMCVVSIRVYAYVFTCVHTCTDVWAVFTRPTLHKTETPPARSQAGWSCRPVLWLCKCDGGGCKIWILITDTSVQLPASDPDEDLSAVCCGMGKWQRTRTKIISAFFCDVGQVDDLCTVIWFIHFSMMTSV